MKKLSGFTIIELMIVVAILAILAALAIPAYRDSTSGTKSNYRKDSDCKRLHGPAWAYAEGWCFIPGTDKQIRYQDTSPSAPSSGPKVNP